MKNFTRRVGAYRHGAKLLPFLILCLAGIQGQSQVSVPSLGTPVTENFNTLANSGTSSTFPTGWALAESGTNANTTYEAGTGSNNAGNTYSFGAAASSERAFGTLLSNSLTPTIGAAFTNNTGTTITSITIAYTGEQWRLGATGREDRLDFQYSTNATSLTSGSWIDVNQLDFSSPIQSGTVGALDGNQVANRRAISHTITGLSIANGATFRIRWTDFNPSGSDDGLAVDDFSLTANGAAGLNTYYRDMDGDGFGNPAVTTMAASAPAGYVTDNTDCDDNDALEKPGQVWYADVDNDGYSNGATLTQCLRPAGYKAAIELAAINGDCNDNNAAINSGAVEICDGLDNDCNGETDESQTVGGAWLNSDVGVDVNGDAGIDCSGSANTINVSASGFSTVGSDKMHLVYQSLCGNGEITTRVLAASNAGWAGITLRESLMPGSRKVALKTQLSSIIRREIRAVANAPANMLNFNRPTHVWLRLTRNGSNFVGYTSMDGEIWDFAFTANVTMTGCIYAGVFAESINTNVETTASFDNVSITGGTPGFSANAPSFTPSLNGLEVSVYPNPSNGEMTLAVQSETDGSLNLTVMDALGRIVRNIELNEGAVFNYPLDLGKEPAGIYYLRLRSESGEENVQRIVVAR